MRVVLIVALLVCWVAICAWALAFIARRYRSWQDKRAPLVLEDMSAEQIVEHLEYLDAQYRTGFPPWVSREWDRCMDELSWRRRVTESRRLRSPADEEDGP